ncbi:pro-glucagon [Amblyraja radiata]|uniref:pro-glucagon n=1 Tax=Amblyraja radiata TaxID=386614 RepID=UPI001403BEB7|nr:pro-glucagon [Amblyraja radiata]
MKGIDSVVVVLLLMLAQNSSQKPIQDSEETSSTLDTSENSLDKSNSLQNVKRHSEGMIASDLSIHMDKLRAKEFVDWLLNNEQNGDIQKRHAEGTYTSDVDSISDYFKAKRFVDSLAGYGKHQNGRGISKRNIESTRYSEGSSKNNLREYLELEAAKDFIDRLIKGRGRREFPEESKENPNKVIPNELDRRHADGTFSSELITVLDAMATKDFINWALNASAVQSRRHADGSFSSELSTVLDTMAAKDFVNWILNSETVHSRRHADGTFSGEISTVLDTMAAKDFVNRILNSKTVQSRDSVMEFFREFE